MNKFERERLKVLDYEEYIIELLRLGNKSVLNELHNIDNLSVKSFNSLLSMKLDRYWTTKILLRSDCPKEIRFNYIKNNINEHFIEEFLKDDILSEEEIEFIKKNTNNWKQIEDERELLKDIKKKREEYKNNKSFEESAAGKALRKELKISSNLNNISKFLLAFLFFYFLVTLLENPKENIDFNNLKYDEKIEYLNKEIIKNKTNLNNLEIQLNSLKTNQK